MESGPATNTRPMHVSRLKTKRGMVLAWAVFSLLGCQSLIGFDIQRPLSATEKTRLPLAGPLAIAGTVNIGGQPLVGATVVLEMPTDRHRTVGSPVVTDAKGAFSVSLAAGPSTGQLALLHATLGNRHLFRVMPGDRLAIQQADRSPLVIDLAATIAARRFLPKLIELQMSGVEAAHGTVRFTTHRTAGLALEEQFRQWLDVRRREAPTDSLSVGEMAFRASGTNAQLATLITGVLGQGRFNSGLSDWVAKANDLIVSNFADGGPVFTPWTWAFDGLKVVSPQINRLAGDTIRISYTAGQELPVDPDRLAAGKGVTDTVLFSNRFIGNADAGSLLADEGTRGSQDPTLEQEPRVAVSASASPEVSARPTAAATPVPTPSPTPVPSPTATASTSATLVSTAAGVVTGGGGSSGGPVPTPTPSQPDTDGNVTINDGRDWTGAPHGSL
ncbi:MAG: hypothetical protein H7338_20250 [Candidatus Sericytochromatia bacterium]|nr:hypothetical protein [Candidatus Sericytochromatia bacterium]